jgi:hypothetical protein
MEVNHPAFCRFVKEQESLTIQCTHHVSVFTNSMDKNPPEKANSSSVSHDNSRILWKTGVALQH